MFWMCIPMNISSCVSCYFAQSMTFRHMVYKKFLKNNHPYRRLWKAFNGQQDNDVAPKPLTK